MSRYAKTRDANEPAIRDALARAGASVEIIEGRRKGTPDLLVGFRGVTYLLEVKNPAARIGVTGTEYLTAEERAPGGAYEGYPHSLRRCQADWHREWRGHQVHIVETPEQALRAVGVFASSCYFLEQGTPGYDDPREWWCSTHQRSVYQETQPASCGG